MESGDRYISLANGNCWTLGRSSDNTIVLPDRWMSRAHAMLQRTDGGDFYLIDLGSRNGSFLNGRRVSIPVTIKNGDRLTLGQTELDFHCPLPQPQDEDDPNTEEPATAVLSVRRLISVMVIDIRNFTVLTRQIDEALLSETIGTWFRQAGLIIRESGSWVDKYIGDAVMAVWFHAEEIANINDTQMQQIGRALVQLNQMTTELNHKYPLPFPLRIGAGVNTGYAMVGNTGSGDRPDYTAIGDTVNAAFRLESSTKQIKKEVALGRVTYHYLSRAIALSGFEERTVRLKGYDDPILAYGGFFRDLEAAVATLELES